MTLQDRQIAGDYVMTAKIKNAVGMKMDYLLFTTKP